MVMTCAFHPEITITLFDSVGRTIRPRISNVKSASVLGPFGVLPRNTAPAIAGKWNNWWLTDVGRSPF